MGSAESSSYICSCQNCSGGLFYNQTSHYTATQNPHVEFEYASSSFQPTYGSVLWYEPSSMYPNTGVISLPTQVSLYGHQGPTPAPFSNIQSALNNPMNMAPVSETTTHPFDLGKIPSSDFVRGSSMSSNDSQSRCDECKQSFKSSRDWVRHLKTALRHNPPRFGCPINGCSRRYTRKDNLLRHCETQHSLES
jgi:hypothetical protein